MLLTAVACWGTTPEPSDESYASREFSLYEESPVEPSWISREVSVAAGDSAPPPPVTTANVHAIDGGLRIAASWDEYDSLSIPDLGGFAIYVSDKPLENVSGVSPAEFVPPDTRTVVVAGVRPGVDQYLAIVPVDSLGNFFGSARFFGAYALVQEVFSREVSVVETDPMTVQFSREISLYAGEPEPPTIVGIQVPEFVFTGETLRVATEVVGLPPFTHAWTINNEPEPVQKGGVLVVSNLLQRGSISIGVTVMGPNGTASAPPMTVRLVDSPPMLDFEPVTMRLGTEGLGDLLTKNVRGSLPIGVQWFRNGSAIPGQTNRILAASVLRDLGSGWYSVLLSNRIGAADFPAAWILPTNTPAIVYEAFDGTVSVDELYGGGNPYRNLQAYFWNGDERGRGAALNQLNRDAGFSASLMGNEFRGQCWSWLDYRGGGLIWKGCGASVVLRAWVLGPPGTRFRASGIETNSLTTDFTQMGGTPFNFGILHRALSFSRDNNGTRFVTNSPSRGVFAEDGFTSGQTLKIGEELYSLGFETRLEASGLLVVDNQPFPTPESRVYGSAAMALRLVVERIGGSQPEAVITGDSVASVGQLVHNIGTDSFVRSDGDRDEIVAWSWRIRNSESEVEGILGPHLYWVPRRTGRHEVELEVRTRAGALGRTLLVYDILPSNGISLSRLSPAASVMLSWPKAAGAIEMTDSSAGFLGWQPIGLGGEAEYPTTEGTFLQKPFHPSNSEQFFRIR